MYTVPKVSELFSDATSEAEVAQRFEDYKASFRDVIRDAESGTRKYVKGLGWVSDPTAQIAALDRAVSNITKGMSADDLAGIAGDLDHIKGMQAELAKDWQSAAFNSRSGLMQYDLRVPSKKIVPKQTPLVNRISRDNSGRGGALEFRRIVGWTNSRTGGVADMMAGFNSEATGNTFGGVTGLRRPNKIQYVTDAKIVAYIEQGLSDSVTHKAQYQGRGFEDIVSLSQTALMWASKGAEERAALYARGATANGYLGAVGAPTIAQSSASTGGAIGAATYYIKVTANAGGGESVVSNEVNTGALPGSANSITVNVTSEPTGALNYNLYVGTASGAETYQTSFVGNSFTLTTYATGGAAMPGADSTVSSSGTLYDGMLSVFTDPAQAGYVKRVNGKLSTSNPGDEFQQAFVRLYGADVVGSGDKRLADPNVIFVDGNVRKEMSDLLKNNASTTAYRIALTESDATGGARIGSLVSGIVNEVTGTMVDFEVHPYMPSGAAVIWSETLPMQDSEISQTVEFVNVVDYMAYYWPDIQMTYDQSTYWYGTMAFYAPAWSGALLGIQ
jgi:hypothetical protein